MQFLYVSILTYSKNIFKQIFCFRLTLRAPTVIKEENEVDIDEKFPCLRFYRDLHSKSIKKFSTSLIDQSETIRSMKATCKCS